MSPDGDRIGQPRAGDPMDAPTARAAQAAGRSAWFALSLLLAASILNTLDGSIVGLVSEPLKHDLHLSDTALGVVNGAGYVVFYALFGIPVARWADRGVRRSILALGMTLWSTMMVLCGFVQTLGQLIAVRAGVAVGVSAGAPTSLSLIADLFPPGRRMRATSLYQAAPFVGITAGLPLVGWLVTHHGWRSAMIVLGLPGLLLALVIRLTLREPPRGRYDAPQARQAPAATLAQALGALLTNRAFMLITLGMALAAAAGSAMAGFVPAFMQRTHAMSPLEVGLTMGLVMGAASMAGTVAGGFIADAIRKRTGGDYWVVALFLAAQGLALIAMAGFLGLDARTPMLMSGAALSFLNSLKTGPFIAIGLAMAPPDMRGLAATLLAVIASAVLAGAAGPLLVGVLSDALAPSQGAAALREALLWVCCGGLAASTAVFVLVLPLIRRTDRQGLAV
jgi:predicted MFS family arabinose efflux permease